MCKVLRAYLKSCNASQLGLRDQRNIWWQKWTVNMCTVTSRNTGVLSMKRAARVTIRQWKWPSHCQPLVMVCGRRPRATGRLTWQKVKWAAIEKQNNEVPGRKSLRITIANYAHYISMILSIPSVSLTFNPTIFYLFLLPPQFMRNIASRCTKVIFIAVEKGSKALSISQFPCNSSSILCQASMVLSTLDSSIFLLEIPHTNERQMWKQLWQLCQFDLA